MFKKAKAIRRSIAATCCAVLLLSASPASAFTTGIVGGFSNPAATAKIRFNAQTAYARAWGGTATTRFASAAWCRNAVGSHIWYYSGSWSWINGPEVSLNCALNTTSGYLTLDNNWAQMTVA